MQLNLATLQPVINVNPPEMPDWIIRPRKLYKRKLTGNMDEMHLMKKEGAKQDSAEDESLAAAPAETRNTTYSIWSLGKKNVAAGSRQRLNIKDESWPAEFLFYGASI